LVKTVLTLNSTSASIPVHSLERGEFQINILPLDHSNPYDYKREHRHSYYEVILTQKGGCSQLIDFKNYPGNDFSCYLISPQQVHLMQRNSASGIVLQFSEGCIYSNELRSGLRQLLFRENTAVIFEYQPEKCKQWIQLLEILAEHLPATNSTINSAAVHLLHAFVSLILDQLNKDDSNDLLPDQKELFDFYQLLESHYHLNTGVAFYVDQLGITDKKLSLITKKHVGFSPLQVIHNRILLEAKRLLLFEDISHKEIAYQLGFDSPASFSAFIKSKTGFSPKKLTVQLAEIHK
jgi:AraC family transcriptional activator of pobA